MPETTTTTATAAVTHNVTVTDGDQGAVEFDRVIDALLFRFDYVETPATATTAAKITAPPTRGTVALTWGAAGFLAAMMIFK